MFKAPPLLTCPPPPQSSSVQPHKAHVAAADDDKVAELPELFNRRIEFHLARKSSNGFGSYSSDKGEFQMEILNPESNSGRVQSSESRALKPEGGDRNGLDAELLSLRLTFKRIGAGLQNLGNTCFLNSVLQCLTYTEPLAAYLQSGKHQTSCRAAGFCALCAIQRHVSRALNSSGRILAPKDLVSNLRSISRNFRNARQEDAHEYMVNLLESMHKCCLPSGIPTESPTAYDRSLVHKIFGGRLRSQVKCLQCSYCSNKFDPFLDLSLEILKADSLFKALNHFTAKEQLDGGERQYQCQHCNQKVKALKQLTIHKPPHVLAIHLKRFGSHVQGQKINKKVEFGPTLDLKPFVTGPHDGDLKYTLYGVLVHAGWSTHSGHYYCFVRTSSGIWYSLDDNQVVQVGERKVLEQKAYMLFYVRDQKKLIPKKPAEVVHKETETDFKVLKGSIQNGHIEIKSNGSLPHASTQGDVLNANVSNEGLIKISVGANVSKADQATYLDMNAKWKPGKDSSLANLNVTASNGGLVKIPADAKGSIADYPTSLDVKKSLSLKDSSVSNPNTGEKVASSLDKPSTIDTCTGITSCNGHAGVEKVVIDAVDRQLDSNILGSAEETYISMKTQKVESLKLSGDSSRSATDNGQNHELPTTLEIFPQKKSADKTSHLAVKKKLFKTPIMKMHLSTNIIFRTTLYLRKKKKHKGRSCSLVNKKSGQEHSAGRSVKESGLGPSTSEIYKRPSHGVSSCSDNKKKNGNKSSGKGSTVVTADTEIIIDECKERVCLNDQLVSAENFRGNTW
ncbi:hypothetical protein Leryth_007371 [Lithospermum erythrorhizon]|nr:hypothetical protein Leryth_007371 [Lithospermum erythrorhizon]